jgi:hypothetical protein
MTNLKIFFGSQVTSGHTIAVGQVTETELAQAITWAPKNRLVAQSLEADLAQAVGRVKTRLLGQPTETEFAQAAGTIKIKAVGQSTEADVAQAVGRTKTAPIGLASETDLAQAVGRIKSSLIGQALETDLAQVVTPALGGGHIIPVGQTLETDLAQPLVVVLSGAPPYLPPVHWVEPVLIAIDWLRIEEEELAVLIA